jgi:hypothetical protein
LDELVLTPESVSKGVFYAAGVVAHELVHLANAVAGREDTSRDGRYYNRLFQTTAEAMGLIVNNNGVHGWCDTRLREDLTACVRALIGRGDVDTHVFKYQRNLDRTWRASLVKVSCGCGVFAYLTHSRAGRVLRCGACGGILSPETEAGKR